MTPPAPPAPCPDHQVFKPPLLHKMMRCGPVMDLLTVYGVVSARPVPINVDDNDKASFRMYFYEIEDS